VAVDRFGIKPLYWAQGPHGLVFGSELSSVLASELVPRELDPQALSEYFALGYVPAPACILAGVQKLLPGTWLTWSRGSEPVLERYWEPPLAQTLNEADARELPATLLGALRDAVRSHLVSDVPLGAFLSGGIDSSVIVALMAEDSPRPVKTFSIGFDDPEHDELDKARLVASCFGTDHHEHVVEPATVDVLPKLVSHFAEPFADSSALPTYHVSALAAGSVKVASRGTEETSCSSVTRRFGALSWPVRFSGCPNRSDARSPGPWVGRLASLGRCGTIASAAGRNAHRTASLTRSTRTEARWHLPILER
jgi:asparagine synthase (glutamine-hydrolysing)